MLQAIATVYIAHYYRIRAYALKQFDTSSHPMISLVFPTAGLKTFKVSSANAAHLLPFISWTTSVEAWSD